MSSNCSNCILHDDLEVRGSRARLDVMGSVPTGKDREYALLKSPTVRRNVPKHFFQVSYGGLALMDSGIQLLNEVYQRLCI